MTSLRGSDDLDALLERAGDDVDAALRNQLRSLQVVAAPSAATRADHLDRLLGEVRAVSGAPGPIEDGTVRALPLHRPRLPRRAGRVAAVVAFKVALAGATAAAATTGGFLVTGSTPPSISDVFGEASELGDAEVDEFTPDPEVVVVPADVEDPEPATEPAAVVAQPAPTDAPAATSLDDGTASDSPEVAPTPAPTPGPSPSPAPSSAPPSAPTDTTPPADDATDCATSGSASSEDTADACATDGTWTPDRQGTGGDPGAEDGTDADDASSDQGDVTGDDTGDTTGDDTTGDAGDTPGEGGPATEDGDDGDGGDAEPSSAPTGDEGDDVDAASPTRIDRSGDSWIGR